MRAAESGYHSVKSEYSNVMGERDSVLRENEELSGAKERLQVREGQCSFQTYCELAGAPEKAGQRLSTAR